jgi:hypothetical protein
VHPAAPPVPKAPLLLVAEVPPVPEAVELVAAAPEPLVEECEHASSIGSAQATSRTYEGFTRIFASLEKRRRPINGSRRTISGHTRTPREVQAKRRRFERD